MITSNEITNKEFSTRIRGYDQEEVKSFLEVIAKDFAELTAENNDLNDRIEMLTVKLDEYVEKHDSLNRSILVAQDAADRLKEDAHAEANHLVSEAQNEADRIREASRKKSHDLLEEAINKVHFVQKEMEALREQSVNFKYELHDMLKHYHTTITDNRWDKVLSMETIKQIDLTETKSAVAMAAKLDDNKNTNESNTQSEITKTQEKNQPSDQSGKNSEGHTVAVEFPDEK